MLNSKYTNPANPGRNFRMQKLTAPLCVELYCVTQLKRLKISNTNGKYLEIIKVTRFLLETQGLQNMKHKSHALHYQNKPSKGMGWQSPLEWLCAGSGLAGDFLIEFENVQKNVWWSTISPLDILSHKNLFVLHALMHLHSWSSLFVIVCWQIAQM